MPNPECFLFVGPTLYHGNGVPLPIPDGVRLLPPVQRGDVEKLCATERGGVIALVDGLFHQNLAVAHIEIRQAVQAGWEVWGLSSMGAIRAYEMRHMSVQGYGQVYQHFIEAEDFQDDEVALLHDVTPPYRSLSEPMVHLRTALSFLEDSGQLSGINREQIEAELKSLWYGERTLPRFASLLTSKTRTLSPTDLKGFLAGFDRFRIKTNDLEHFLAEKPWQERT
jgi:hypothetical protein